ncbi:MAG: hypothetical protein VX899_18875 [Myxococcota bacterium]|nr:hypothetical protein [Myxococcota bacterium]
MSILLLSALACVPETGHPAPADATIDPTPDEYNLVAGSAGILNDGVGYLLAIDAMVLDNEGIPMSDIEVEFTSEWGGMYLLPEAAIREVDAPDPDAEGADCDLSSESYDAELCAWYDLDSEMYFELSPSYVGEYKPNYGIGKTDRHGIARVWVYVDAFPTTDTGFTAVFLTTSITYSTAVVTFSPDDNGA